MAGEATPPTPPEPTVAQLRAEVEALKTKIAGMVPSEERDALKKELEAARGELAAVKKSLEAPPEKSGFFRFPRLF